MLLTLLIHSLTAKEIHYACYIIPLQAIKRLIKAVNS